MRFFEVEIEGIVFNVGYGYADDLKAGDMPEVEVVYLNKPDCFEEFQFVLKTTVMAQITSALRAKIERLRALDQ